MEDIFEKHLYVFIIRKQRSILEHVYSKSYLNLHPDNEIEKKLGYGNSIN